MRFICSNQKSISWKGSLKLKRNSLAGSVSRLVQLDPTSLLTGTLMNSTIYCKHNFSRLRSPLPKPEAQFQRKTWKYHNWRPRCNTWKKYKQKPREDSIKKDLIWKLSYKTCLPESANYGKESVSLKVKLFYSKIRLMMTKSGVFTCTNNSVIDFKILCRSYRKK